MMSELLLSKIRILRRHDWREKSDSSKKWNVALQGFKSDEWDLKGVGEEALRQWMTDPSKTPEPASFERLVEFVNTVLYTAKFLEVKHFKDDFSFNEFCAVIGYGEEKAEQEHYQYIFPRMGPHVDYIYPNIKTAQDALDRLRGLYKVYRQEPADLGGRTTSMGLAIILAVHPSDRKDDSRYSIVCKLSIPSMTDVRPYFYLGTVSNAPRFISFGFRQQNEEFRDVVMMIIAAGNPTASSFERNGVMSTLGQDAVFRPISYNIIVRRMNGEFGVHEVDDFLRASVNTDVGPEESPFRLPRSKKKKR